MIPKTHRLAQLKNFKGRIYLVGGWVRDYLLGRPSQDFDFLIEGSESHYAQALAQIKKIYPPVRNSEEVFPEYVTVRWFTKTGERVDCARPRTETYDHPGSLPKVRLAGSVREDLIRRDFAANAVAVGVSKFVDNDWVDLYEGRRDIQERKLRILHPKSFQDDPTRLMRGLRLGTRLGFKFDSQTQVWAQEALLSGALKFISWPRFRDEFFKAMDESDWMEIGMEFARQGIVLGNLTKFGSRALKTALSDFNAHERLAAVYFWNLLNKKIEPSLSRQDWAKREWGQVMAQLERLSQNSWRPSEPVLPATLKVLKAVKPSWAAVFQRSKPAFVGGSDLKKFNIVESERGALMKYFFEQALKGRLKNRRQALAQMKKWI